MKYHLIGIGGTAMGHLAVLLRQIGHSVTGSDEGIYSPMKDLLEDTGIAAAAPYAAANIGEPDVVIVGNAIGRGNVELEAALDRRLPLRSQAEVLKEAFLERSRCAVVAGTHGKTTCASLLAWLLQDIGAGFFVGGIPIDFGCGARSGSGEAFVVEGDEYDTAFFDKGPKFHHYRPWLVMLNPVEYDHADIYADTESYLLAFERLVNLIPAGGRLILYEHGPGVERFRRRARCPIIGFGRDGDAHRPIDIRDAGGGSRTFGISGLRGRFETSLIGMHNLTNAVGCILAAREMGVDPARAAELLGAFRGVKRRQELVLDRSGVLVYDDFAHHPTAIAETLRAFRESLPGRRIWAVFEPRSWSMRKNVFQDALPGAFKDADRVTIGPVFRLEKVAGALDPAGVAQAISEQGIRAEYVGEVDEIARQITSDTRPGDAVVVLSNGSFGGLVGKLQSLIN